MNLARRLLPDLATLHAFECAARHGNFTRAAAELSLTQSAVSRQIKDLEKHLGTLLFERVRQRVILSEDGRRFLPEARRLLQQTEDMMLRTMASADAQQTLSVATLPTFGSRWLSPRLSDFSRSHPGAILNLASRSAPFDLDEENFDLAIHYGQPFWARATCTYLCSEAVVPVANAELMSRMGASEIEPRSLAAQPLLHLATRPKLWSQWFESVELEADNAYRGHRFDQFAMIIEAAVAGMGFALVPLYLIEAELKSGKLQIASNFPMATENAYYIVTPETKQALPLAARFKDWLLGQVTPAPAD